MCPEVGLYITQIHSKYEIGGVFSGHHEPRQVIVRAHTYLCDIDQGLVVISIVYILIFIIFII